MCKNYINIMRINLFRSRIKFFTNIVLPSILAVVLFIVTLFYVVIPHFENAMMDRKREMITELTNAATSILEKYYKDEVDSVLTRSEAQRLAISRIQYLRYGEENKDYFWITDMTPVMIVHPYRPELNGQNLEEYPDSHGTYMFVEFVNTVKKDGHGYVEYMWQWKDDPTRIVPKLSYVQGFKPWGWIVGTGIYIEDVKNEISDLSKTFTRISIIISAVIILILFWISRQSFNIERKRRLAEEELNESREKYRSLVEASTEGLIMYVDNQISFVNPIFEEMAGARAEEILKKNINEIIQLPEDILELVQNNSQLNNQTTIESKVLRADNRDLDVVINIIPIDFYGKQAIIFSAKDVSSDKLIKEELVFNKEKFQTLMDKLNQGIFRTSLDKKGKSLEANSTALRILGYDKFEELKDKYILDFFVDEIDKRSFRRKLLESGFIKNQIIKLNKKNGEQILAAVSLIVIYDEGEPKFCDGIIKDVTLQESEDDNVDAINHSFISFSQLFYQAVSNFAKPLVKCSFDEDISQLSAKMTEDSSNIAVVLAESGEVLGYISDEIIRSRLFSDDNNPNTKAFAIMTSPVPYIGENRIILEAVNRMKKEKLDFLILKSVDNKSESYISLKDLVILQEFVPAGLLGEIENVRTANDLKIIREKFIAHLIPVIDNNTHSAVIFKSLALLSDLICRRIIEITLDEMGPAPARFTFLCLGSEGRQEETLKTDQDNALIYDDAGEGDHESRALYFNEFSKKVCTALDTAGYAFCTGNVMAMNPDWCQPLSVWKGYFTKWINSGNAQDLLDISIFFDFRAVYGEDEFAESLKKHILVESKKNSAYLHILAQSTINLKPQVGFWGNILLETAGAPPETVNIKKTIMPIVNFARIYALKYGISELNTIDRLKEIHELGHLNQALYSSISQAFEYLAMMRLQHQTSLIQRKANPDNLINTKLLSELDKTIIKKLLSYINNMLSKLSYDYKGSY